MINKNLGLDLVLKNRFGVSFEKDDGSFLSALKNPLLAIKEEVVSTAESLNPFSDVDIATFKWDDYVESVSSTVNGTVFNPVKLSDVYEYVKSFEQNSHVTISFVMLDYKILMAILKWIDKVYDKGFGYYGDYAGYNMMLSLKSLDTVEDFDQIIFKNIFPVSYRISELNHGKNQAVRLYVEFVFRKFQLGSQSFADQLLEIVDDIF